VRSNKLSQVFLKNEQVLEKIADSINITKKDVIFEIGGGKGPLTKYLVEKAKKVIVCEIDKKLIPFLKDYNATIINENFLKVEIPKEVTKIVGNIPYHLSGKITEKIMKEQKPCTILYQKEFAQRIVAKPGNKGYSRIGVLAQTLSIPKILFYVSKNDFKPVPKVDSALVSFTPLNKEYDEGFFKFIKTLFKFKNKSVKNALLCGRMDWSNELDKRKLKEKVNNNSEKKVFTLNIEELEQEYKLFKE